MKATIHLNALIVVLAVTAMAVLSSIALAQQPAPDVSHRLQQQRASALTPAERVARFQAADTDHDGLLSREEAAAGLPRVALHFDEIDMTGSGLVSFSQIEAYVLRRSAWRAASVGPMT